MVTRGRQVRTGPDPWLRLIALFKFGKTVLLLGVGLGALQLLNPDIAASAQSWATTFATGSDRRFLQHLLAQVAGLPPARLDLIAMAAFLYAALFTIEGTGLWLGRRWAEYLTVVATASFLPIEILELVRRLTVPRGAALILNFLVVVYLNHRLRRSRRDSAGHVDRRHHEPLRALASRWTHSKTPGPTRSSRRCAARAGRGASAS